MSKFTEISESIFIKTDNIYKVRKYYYRDIHEKETFLIEIFADITYYLNFETEQERDATYKKILEELK